MSTPDSLFTEASTLATTLSRRLRDLREYQLPRLRDCRDVGIQGEIAAEMREDLGLVYRNVEVGGNYPDWLGDKRSLNVNICVTGLYGIGV